MLKLFLIGAGAGLILGMAARWAFWSGSYLWWGLGGAIGGASAAFVVVLCIAIAVAAQIGPQG